MIKCNNNYKSQYAFIDNVEIHIGDYIKNRDHISDNKIKCNKGHDLICVNGLKNKPHFRHKNINDLSSCRMTQWHSEWQGNFSNTEIEYKGKNNQIKVRYADVSIKNSTYNLEFQNSHIDLQEVKNRKHDYELHDRNIIWIINGNNSIKIKHLEYSERYYLEFISDKWKYESFIDYDRIFIDINCMLYKIYPKYVKNNMIDCETPIDKDTFIKYIYENNEEIHSINIPLQSTLYIKQQGAGNGKTFGLIQNIECKDFEHYKCFIIVTKQHSAKSIIYNELKSQIDNNQLKYITDLQYVNENKKYQISYKNTNTNNICNILIATIDSLMYSLGNSNNKELDKFEGIITSIIDGYIEVNNIKEVKCNGKNYKLNKELCLFVDETQDLKEDYAKAIITIMRNKYIDSYIVGDKLQSITLENNAFQYFSNNDFSYIQKKLYTSTNVCRRFYHDDLIKFINYMIPFSKYYLPEIEQYKKDDEPEEQHLVIFEGNTIYALDTENGKITKEVNDILKYYDYEVQKNNYKPNDFLIVTPFTKQNPLVNALEIAIETYWINKNNTNVYERYAVFHKSEEGTSINLADSENSTRIVSIHTAKGDGRNIVFVIGLNEQGLLKYSNESNNLVYDSLIHVSLTRMKKKLYIRYTNNNDDISSKILKYIYDNDFIKSDIKPANINISFKIKYKDIIDDIFKKQNYENLLNKIIIPSKHNTSFDNLDKKIIIDSSHHDIRYASMIIYLYIKIIRNNMNNDKIKKKQLVAIFNNIINKDILELSYWGDYYDSLKNNKLCILKITNNGKDYIRYYDIIVSFMKDVKSKLNKILLNKIKMLCPMESIILHYMIDIVNNGLFTNFNINELYNIINIYSKAFNNSFEGHNNCLCKKYFNSTQCIETNKNIDIMNNYLNKHYEDIYNVGKIYDKFLQQYSNVNWLLDHQIVYNGANDDYKLSKNFKLISYDDNDVFIIYIKPQFNELNLYDTLIDSIYDTFLIKNIKKPLENSDKKEYDKYSEDFKKFNKKNITTVVFSLDNKNYKAYQWYDKENRDLIDNKFILEQIRKKLINKYTTESKYVYNYYKYYRENNKELNAKKLIKNFINIYKNNEFYDKMPQFLLRFFQKIEDDILSNKKKEQILEMYDDKEFFLIKLHEIIIRSIDEYLDIEDDDDDDEDDEDNITLCT